MLLGSNDHSKCNEIVSGSVFMLCMMLWGNETKFVSRVRGDVARIGEVEDAKVRHLGGSSFDNRI